MSSSALLINVIPDFARAGAIRLAQTFLMGLTSALSLHHLVMYIQKETGQDTKLYSDINSNMLLIIMRKVIICRMKYKSPDPPQTSYNLS